MTISQTFAPEAWFSLYLLMGTPHDGQDVEVLTPTLVTTTVAGRRITLYSKTDQGEIMIIRPMAEADESSGWAAPNPAEAKTRRAAEISRINLAIIKGEIRDQLPPEAQVVLVTGIAALERGTLPAPLVAVTVKQEGQLPPHMGFATAACVRGRNSQQVSVHRDSQTGDYILQDSKGTLLNIGIDANEALDTMTDVCQTGIFVPNLLVPQP